MTFSVHRDGTITRVSRALASWLGHTDPRSLRGAALASLLDTRDASWLQREVGEALDGGASVLKYRHVSGKHQHAISFYRAAVRRDELLIRVTPADTLDRPALPLRYHDVAAAHPTVLWLADARGMVLSKSSAWQELTGQAPNEAVGDGWLQRVHPDDRAHVMRQGRSAIAAEGDIQLEYRVLTPSDEPRWVRDIGRPYRDTRGRYIGHCGSITDVHTIVTQRERLRERESQLERMNVFRSGILTLMRDVLDDPDRSVEAFYEQVLQWAALAIPNVDAGSVMVRTPNDTYRFVAMLAFELEHFRHLELTSDQVGFNHPHGDPTPRIVARPAAHTSRNLTEEQREVLHNAGHIKLSQIASTLVVPIHVSGEPHAYLMLDSLKAEHAFDNDGIELATVFASYAGVLAQRHTYQLRLEHLAYRDALTQLPNREYFSQRLRERLERDPGRGLALLFLDIDNLKPINDSLGHDAGDTFLQHVAERLQHLHAPGLQLARWGGDEFVMTVDLDAHSASRFAANALERLMQPLIIGHHTLHPHASIGIAHYPQDTSTPNELVRLADVAMYHAKRDPHHPVAHYTPSMDESNLERLQLESDLRAAIANGELVTYYQPIIDLGTNRISGFEALTRWPHPTRGFVSPDQFIPIAERTGLIHDIGVNTIENASRALNDLHRTDPGIRISINLSPRELTSEQFHRAFQAIAKRHGIDPAGLEFEVTERTAIHDLDTASARLDSLRALGCGIALDDFGSGYSSLTALQQLPITTLKLDKAFVRDIATNPAARALTHAVTHAADSLGLRIVAEGIETSAQHHTVVAAGTHEAQGYLYSPALPLAEAHAFLERNQDRPTWSLDERDTPPEV